VSISSAPSHAAPPDEMTIRFFTEDSAVRPGRKVARHILGKGNVRVDRNDSHGITKHQEAIFFNSMGELPAKIELALREAGITVVEN